MNASGNTTISAPPAAHSRTAATARLTVRVLSRSTVACCTTAIRGMRRIFHPFAGCPYWHAPALPFIGFCPGPLQTSSPTRTPNELSSALRGFLTRKQDVDVAHQLPQELHFARPAHAVGIHHRYGRGHEGDDFQ